MGLENNWRVKTLENLEKDVWSPTDADSRLVQKVYNLRRKPLNEFSIEDLRLLIVQQEGLLYTVPLAIEILTTDLFAEGDCYRGDLLQSLLNIELEYWLINKNHWCDIQALILGKLTELKEEHIDTKIFFSASRH